MFEQNFDQSILEQRGPEKVFYNDNPSVLGVDQKPFEVEAVDKVHEDGVQFVRVGGLEDPDVVHLARDDASGAHLTSVPALGRVPPDVKHHGVFLGDESDALIKGHGSRFTVDLKEYMQVFKFLFEKNINLNSWKL